MELGDPTASPEAASPSFPHMLGCARARAPGCCWGGGGPRPGPYKGEKPAHTDACRSCCCKATPFSPTRKTRPGGQSGTS